MAERPQDAAPADDDLAAYLTPLGERVRTMRTRRAMSRKALAKHSDVSERYLAQLEGGTGNCSIVLLRRIAHALSVRVAELIDDRPERAILKSREPLYAKADVILATTGQALNRSLRDLLRLAAPIPDGTEHAYLAAN
jgi:transcriptional regulator with XRE-family HTH domain